ncbi:hypothetical protein [Schinkia azotoformans]|uniref:hypothetical protein n=1 Tax=Schinkia azotoformans TaxID=1454 RepID=UPI002DB65882|nr:hypothetical protein [Schinkia azotoformans]MEC1716580.1 hypothetical protein [Schinkia azotoformans]MEC1739418.1 hypothetical protein [Schinkia azotoformans]MEC1745512.1 hypothetical protein [Schinkia azotoformans]MEC1756575.1 hypothetical protein [Schinkia azotoformans]MEC1765842.1 hypothetical protein [Schinkia azotoformans]
MYKILYTRFISGQRHVVVFDFKGEQTIEFTLDELEKDELSEELKQHIAEIREQVDSGYFDYAP